MTEVFDISIVISSFNREDKISQTIDSIFKNDLSGFQKIELIVVDDGSPRPVENILPAKEKTPDIITLRLLKHPNAGIGTTRNRGFAEARSGFVLFLDDDIILFPDTIKKFYLAQKEHPGAVFFGSAEFISYSSAAIKKFAYTLFGFDGITKEKNYREINGISSGLLAVNKEKLGISKDFYRNNFTVPASEEYELITRFCQQQVPIIYATHISAIHNHHLELAWLIEQQFKYGLATAEAFAKMPSVSCVESFSKLKGNLESRGFRKRIKTLFSTRAVRKLLFFFARILEKMTPERNHNAFFGKLTSAFYLAGYRKGKKIFRKDDVNNHMLDPAG